MSANSGRPVAIWPPSQTSAICAGSVPYLTMSSGGHPGRLRIVRSSDMFCHLLNATPSTTTPSTNTVLGEQVQHQVEPVDISLVRESPAASPTDRRPRPNPAHIVRIGEDADCAMPSLTRSHE